MAFPILALASIAADLMSKKDEDNRWKTANLGQIEQSRLGDFKQIVQGGRATHEYGQLARPTGSSGLGGALQALGSLAGAFGGGSESETPSTNLEKPDLLKNYDPEADAKYKGGLSLFNEDAGSGVPKDISAATEKPLVIGAIDVSPGKLTDNPDDVSDSLTKSVIKRSTPRFGGSFF
jgi:hypothetical protein